MIPRRAVQQQVHVVVVPDVINVHHVALNHHVVRRSPGVGVVPIVARNCSIALPLLLQLIPRRLLPARLLQPLHQVHHVRPPRRRQRNVQLVENRRLGQQRRRRRRQRHRHVAPVLPRHLLDRRQILQRRLAARPAAGARPPADCTTDTTSHCSPDTAPAPSPRSPSDSPAPSPPARSSTTTSPPATAAAAASASARWRPGSPCPASSCSFRIRARCSKSNCTIFCSVSGFSTPLFKSVALVVTVNALTLFSVSRCASRAARCCCSARQLRPAAPGSCSSNTCTSARTSFSTGCACS